MKNRYPIAVAFALALTGTVLLTFTARHEGTGPVVVQETGDRARETEASVLSDLLIPAQTGTKLTSCFAGAGFVPVLRPEPAPSPPQA
ncbi:MAG: hypothetical protein LBF93_03530, partial [Zoogloeaceae bacterium]|nr:hypothetical protein [Zoogloeaceae bacterium]